MTDNNFSPAGEILSIAEAARQGVLKRGTAIELLEAQAATGNIVDPKTGNKMSVKQARAIGEWPWPVLSFAGGAHSFYSVKKSDK